MKRFFFILLVLTFLTFSFFSVGAKRISTLDVENGEFFLLDAVDNGVLVVRALESYQAAGRFLIPVTPLFDSLRLNYKLSQSSLTVHVGDEVKEIDFEAAFYQGSDAVYSWYKDEYYTYIDSQMLEQLFGIKVSVDLRLLRISLETGEFRFPYKVINLQQQRRAQFVKPGITDSTNKVAKRGAITLDDTYRLYTLPKGYLDYTYGKNLNKENYSLTTSLISDLLYHSTSLVYTETENTRSGRLTLSRYKSSDDEQLLGYWDKYSFGDVYTLRKELDSTPSRGFGMNFLKNGSGLTHNNLTTSFYEEAPPGWEVEIFHNNVYLGSRIVPDDGLLDFNSMELVFGSNHFKLLLFGPFGEEKVIHKTIDLRRPRLAKGDSSVRLSLSDSDFSWVDGNTSEFNPNMSWNYEYGATDWWSTGVGVIVNNDDWNTSLDSVSFDNAVYLPNLLIENDLNIAESGDYSQLTSFATSVFGGDSLAIRYRSKGTFSSDNNEPESNNGSVSYATNFENVNLALVYNTSSTNGSRTESWFNRVAVNIGNNYFSNDIRYIPGEDKENSVLGNFTINSRMTKQLRGGLEMPYKPNDDEIINPDSVRLSVDYQVYTEEEIRHRAKFSVSSVFNDNRWQALYNIAWKKPSHQFYLRSIYNYNDSYSLQAGVQFFFGYDHHNNQAILSSELSPHSGSLDVHAYLDRYINGKPDELDYDLQGVEFNNVNGSIVKTGRTGKVRIMNLNPGPNYISATWKNGTKTYSNNYVVYSHPGSVNSANMPFYLNSEFESYVYLQVGDEIIPQRNAIIKVTNLITSAEMELTTDIDGYFYADNLTPGSYKIELDPEYLNQKGYSIDISGYQFDTSLKGGFVVIPEFILQKSEQPLAQSIQTLKLDETNSQPLVEEEQLMHLPQKQAIVAPYSLDKVTKTNFSGVGTIATADLDMSDVAEVINNGKSNKLGVHVIRNLTSSGSDEDVDYVLYIGEFSSLAEAQRQALLDGINNPSFVSGVTARGERVYRYRLQTFSSKSAAEAFVAEQYSGASYDITTAAKTITFDSGYVIQFAAKKDELDFDAQLQSLASLERLHIARKLVNGEYWNCLISHVFSDLKEAQDLLDSLAISAFIVPADRYVDTVWSKYQ